MFIFSSLCLIPSQAATVNKEVAVSTETINTSKTELSDLNRLLQSLQIELQSQLTMVGALLPAEDRTLGCGQRIELPDLIRVWSGDRVT